MIYGEYVLFEDTIFINNLTVATIIGVYEWEQAIKQKIIFDIELSVHIGKVYVSDDLEDTIDYKSLTEKIVKYVGDNKFKLIETLADKVAKLILKDKRVIKTKIKVTKPSAISNVKGVGILIERENDTI